MESSTSASSCSSSVKCIICWDEVERTLPNVQCSVCEQFVCQACSKKDVSGSCPQCRFVYSEEKNNRYVRKLMAEYTIPAVTRSKTAAERAAMNEVVDTRRKSCRHTGKKR